MSFSSFKEFYPYYLSEHQDTTCKLLHFMGTSFALGWFVMALIAMNWKFILAGLFFGYLFAWIGHFMFEKNRPATFKHPFYSFAGDFVMWWHIATGKVPL